MACVCFVSNTSYCNNVDGTCTCKTGWNGTTCDLDVNECLNKTICDDVPNSKCYNLDGSYDCVCDPGYRKDLTTRLCHSK